MWERKLRSPHFIFRIYEICNHINIDEFFWLNVSIDAIHETFNDNAPHLINTNKLNHNHNKQQASIDGRYDYWLNTKRKRFARSNRQMYGRIPFFGNLIAYYGNDMGISIDT